MEYLLAILMITIVLMLGYIIFKMKLDIPIKKVDREKKELIKRETKHYSNLMNYSIGKAYGGE